MRKSNKKSLKKTTRRTETSQSETKKKPTNRHAAPDFLARVMLDTFKVSPNIFGISTGLFSLLRGRSTEYWKSIEEKRKSLEERKIEVVKRLLESEIEPNMFDVLLQNEVDRRLKVRFGTTFLIFTFLFTAASYVIVICDGAYNWNISETAITALIIETPIQFIGLLYIIAKSLFPHTSRQRSKKGKRHKSN
jgi:hypothetical protein